MQTPEEPNSGDTGVALFIDHYNILDGCDNVGIPGYNYDVLAEVASKAGQMVFGRVYLVTDGTSGGKLYKFFELGIEPVYTPQYRAGDEDKSKSLADPMMVCDIMQTLYERPFIKTFVIVSGDKDFIPVTRKISEHGKQAIIIGVERSTAQALTTECARLNFKFLTYETLHRDFKRSHPKNEQVIIP
ncbi:MAG: NYN domain-containing protein [Euryarchaeota archaeon]|nr:NYN domain-containing protein [Euryarchaeota archaeon]